MKTTTPTEFLCFSRLPAELRLMVWAEALPSLTTDFQRFNAEIAPHPDLPIATRARDLVLCLTPNNEFVQHNKGYVSLLAACHESRAAAIEKTSCYMPIHYVVRGGDGELAVRFARVPFNPDGQVCISGLGPAFDAATKRYRARGMETPELVSPHILANDIKCVTFPDIKNLTIALDPPRDYESSHRFMLGWSTRAFDAFVRRIARFKLETLAVIDEDWLNERHHIHPMGFRWLHRPVKLDRWSEDDARVSEDHSALVIIPWWKIYQDFKGNIHVFKTLKQLWT